MFRDIDEESEHFGGSIGSQVVILAMQCADDLVCAILRLQLDSDVNA